MCVCCEGARVTAVLVWGDDSAGVGSGWDVVAVSVCMSGTRG